MHSTTRKNLFIAACYALVLILGMIIGPKFSRENGSSTNGSFLSSRNQSGKIGQILKLIESKYVDSVKIDTLQNLAIGQILQHLDPHSTYLPPVEAKFLDEDLQGHFDGIGVEYYIVNDTVLVTTVLPGSPSEKAGLASGDKILRINNRNIAGVNIEASQIVNLIRGRRGTSLQLLVALQGQNKTRTIQVERGKITVSSVDAAYMINKQTGYIKISRFGAQTDEDFLRALRRLKGAGMQSLILDLRENGGGYLNAATELADQFLPDRKLIVYTKGLHEPRTDYYSSPEGEFEKGKLVVLIDEKTASASEILAGAVQDLDRATIVGRRSFGKGLVQEQFDFGDGSVLNLTVAKYYTPSGRSIQKSYKNGVEAYYQEVGNRFSSGEVESDGKHISDSVFEKHKIYKTSHGRTIFGGGGIMPDVYVPIDTSGFNSFYYRVRLKGVIQQFLFEHLVKGLRPSAEEFFNHFQLTPGEYHNFLALANAKGAIADKREAERSRNVIGRELKALMGRYYFGNEMYYKVMNAEDPAIVQSLAVLR